MAIKLGDFFPRRTINEPFLNLDDPKWRELEGGYRSSLYDATTALKQLERAKTRSDVNIIYSDVNIIYEELWDELHHQGDVGLASYYAVPHLIRIAKETGLIDSNVIALVSTIEICRNKDNPKLPGALTPLYMDAIAALEELAYITLKNLNGLEHMSYAFAAIAVSKNQFKLAEALGLLTSETDIDYFLENY